MYAAAEVRDEKSGERRAAAISVGPGTKHGCNNHYSDRIDYNSHDDKDDEYDDEKGQLVTYMFIPLVIDLMSNKGTCTLMKRHGKRLIVRNPRGWGESYDDEMGRGG